MKRIAKFKKQRMCALTAAIVATAWMPTAMALPQGEHNIENINVMDDGKIPVTDNGKTMNVVLNKSRGAVDWNSFNIKNGETVNFSGPGNWMVLNRVVGVDNKIEESIIDGFINGQGGTVFLINPSGITFGKNARVDVGSLVASTLDLTADNFKKDNFNFIQVGDKGAQITNLGNIKASDDGIVALLAHRVVSGGELTVDPATGAYVSAKEAEKSSSIQAGQVAMAAGKNITLELQYDDKISVRLNEKSENNGVKINTSSDAYDFVINASDVTATRGYVLMKAGDAKEIGSHLICQTGVVTANKLAKDEGGNIILQAEIVNAGGKLNADAKNAKIEIDGNSFITAKASAKGEGGQIYIDTKNGASIILAGAQLSADTKITTKSNHSVISLDKYDGNTTSVNVVKKDGTAGDWDIIASKVKIGNDVVFPVDDFEINKIKKLLTSVANFTKETEDETVKKLANIAYTVSNKVLSKTLETTNVNIETSQFPNHYVFSKEGIENAPTNHYTADDVNGDNNIEINADITKASGNKETSLTMKAMGSVNLNADITTDAQKAKALNVTLEARGISGLIDPQTLNHPEKIAYEEIHGDDYIITNGERKITTWGKDNTAGTVTIKSNVDSADVANHGSLTIKSGDTTIMKNVGETKALKNLEIYSKGSVNVNGSVNADDKVIAVATDTPDNDSYLMAKKADGIQNVKVGSITANTVTLAADNDVILNGDITANAINNDRAVEIVAQRNFNNSGNRKVSVKASSYWKIYSDTPANDNFGGLDSHNFARWHWTDKVEGDKNLYIFKYQPNLTITANSGNKWYGQEIKDLKYTWSYDLKGKFMDAFLDGNEALFKQEYGLNFIGTDSEGYPVLAPFGRYDVNLNNTSNTYAALKAMGYNVDLQPGKLNVLDDVRLQQDALTTSNLKGSASYSEAARKVGPGADRVLGLQSAELPFFREEMGQVKLYGTYDVSIDPDKVKMEPTAKVLPEPDQTKNQYREYEKELATEAGTAKFKMTYNGSTFDIYPVDDSAKAVLVAGDEAKNVEVESQALFAAFKEMGITLDNLDGVYTHFDSKKEVQSFRQ